MADIEVKHRGAITWVFLNRPEALNALTPDMHYALQDVFDAYAKDDKQRICVITGAGEKAFCAGSDLKAFGGSYPPDGYAGLIERFDLTKPVIAAVNGFALGGGFEIALASDIVIATENARFGLPEPLIGAVALGGGIHRLVREVGNKQAMGLLLTGRQIDAEESYRLGLVNEIVPAEELEQAVNRWCEEILRCAPLSIDATKQCVTLGLAEPSLEAAMKNQNKYPAFARWESSEDWEEGRKAFAEKRSAKWRGR
ncbi:enoyl-CoA hydratase [Halioglobus maricola]|uniref:Enoyl-CoA hydratase n=1 Tax=Halioglobus maricola TaxID=2601894 RepID=A0A5P9NIK6_9GAMM|nr:enoyl-CoA hydratase-related protein [Halioglobus maricola]QFU75375.1 enoyl-CoA hydratase [Halioglobus maricola]